MAIKKQEQEIVIKAPNIKTMKVKITGNSPLIFHKWSEKAIKMILDKQMKKAKGGHEIRDPKSDFLNSFYQTNEGVIYIPSRNIKQAIVGSGRFVEGIPMTILRGTIFIWGEDDRQIIPVLHNGKKVKLSGEVTEFKEGESPEESLIGYDSKDPNIVQRLDMVTIGMGSADIRFRGQVTDWEAEFMIQFDADILSAEQVLNLLQRAGFSQGLMEWRPEKNGEFGSFTVESK